MIETSCSLDSLSRETACAVTPFCGERRSPVVADSLTWRSLWHLPRPTLLCAQTDAFACRTLLANIADPWATASDLRIIDYFILHLRPEKELLSVYGEALSMVVCGVGGGVFIALCKLPSAGTDSEHLRSNFNTHAHYPPDMSRKLPTKRSSKAQAARRSRHRNLNVAERREILTRDPDALGSSEASVYRRYCRGRISLGRRGGSLYYLGFWVKHKVTRTCRLARAAALNAAETLATLGL
jgi:hypothetical protein